MGRGGTLLPGGKDELPMKERPGIPARTIDTKREIRRAVHAWLKLHAWRNTTCSACMELGVRGEGRGARLGGCGGVGGGVRGHLLLEAPALLLRVRELREAVS